MKFYILHSVHAYLKVLAGRKRNLLFLAVALLSAGAYIFSLPSPLFLDSYSTVLEDSEGRLLSASIAQDGQWRFPESSTVPDKFARAIVAFEDKRFLTHPGVDLLALGRAMRENISQGRIVSGGSTLTMQVIRLSRGNPPRTFFEKGLEIILATRLEWRYSKSEILGLYGSHAPFGGNVVGLEAACWRYFQRSPEELSWAEAALLAVLPNNPSLIHLSRNRSILRVKRNKLLEKLFKQGEMDTVGFSLAVAETIPAGPKPLPRHASHLLNLLAKEGKRKFRSTIDGSLQANVEQTLLDYAERLKANEIHNAAALILDVSTGNVLAYVGNIPSGAAHGDQVDIIRSPRSTGSILKPFLYAAMLDESKMLPGSLIPDVPLLINGFAPRNFSRQLDGAVPANKALIRSLNIPAVFELREYRYEKFHHLLQNLGMSTLHQPPDHYGLSLVLGGAEGTLWDITGMYASAARTLKNYFTLAGRQRYHSGDYHPPGLSASDSTKRLSVDISTHTLLSASSIWMTFETLKELYRPGEETGWQHFSSSKPIAWKTGTSFGFRDGWAIGVNPDFAVGVWVGNADGEGRPGLTGTEAASPLLFNLFSMLPGHSWFAAPTSELSEVITCRRSGYRATALCEERDTLLVPKPGEVTPLCTFHKLIHMTPDMKYRVHAECFPPDKMKSRGWFVLPPVQEYYFRKKNLSYASLPPYMRGCEVPSGAPALDIIYPGHNARIFIPHILDGQPGAVVFEATHRSPSALVFWHLDGTYVGTTLRGHRLMLNPSKGRHVITLVDESGESVQRSFEVISNPE